MIRIRNAVPADRDVCVRMAVRFLESTPYGALMASPPSGAGKLFDLSLLLGIVLLAELQQDDRVWPCGLIAGVCLEHPLIERPYVDELIWWVEPEARGRSIGPRLLAEFEGWAIVRGAYLVKMVAPAGSDVGEFYARAGYTPVEVAHHKRL